MNAKHILVLPVTDLFYERKVTIFRAPKHNFSKAYEEREIIPSILSQVQGQLQVPTAFSTQKKNYYCIAGWEWKDPNVGVLNNPPKKWSLAPVVNTSKKTSTESWLPHVKTCHMSLHHILYNNNAHKYFHIFLKFKSTQSFRLVNSVSPSPKNFILPECWYYSWCGI